MLAPLSPHRVKDGPDIFFSSLRHPLSGPYVELNGRPAGPFVAKLECEALAWLEDQPARLVTADPTDFLDVLEALDRRLAGRCGGWRAGEIGTARDVRGNSIRFPPLSCVRQQLEQLRALLAAEVRGSALFTATMALVLLTNCHPFRDGIPRGPRAVQPCPQAGRNAWRRLRPGSELAARSDGGYLIALRQGELRGNWRPLLEFVMSLLDVHQALAGSATGPLDGSERRREPAARCLPEIGIV